MENNDCKFPIIADKFCKIRLYFCENSNIKFSEMTGISYMSISSLCNGRRNAGKEIMSKVLEAFPEINKSWLLIDDYEGDMLRPGAIQHNNGNQNCTITNVDNSTSSSEEISELRSQLKDANETIHALTSMLSNKMSELQSSVDIINKMLSGEE